MSDNADLDRVLKSIASYSAMRDACQRKAIAFSIASVSMVVLTRVGDIKTQGNTFIEHLEQYIGFIVFFGPVVFCLFSIAHYFLHLRLVILRDSIVKSIASRRIELLPAESYWLNDMEVNDRRIGRGQAMLILCGDFHLVLVLALCTCIMIVTYMLEMKFSINGVSVGLWRTCFPQSGVSFFGGTRVEWDRSLSKNIPWAYPWYPLVYLLSACVQGLATGELVRLYVDRNRRLLRSLYGK